MHRFASAILRSPAPNFAAGLTTVSWAEPPNYARLCEQHEAYAAALRGAGLELELLPALPEYPDAYFVEDVALLLPELAVLTRPGASARAGEVGHIEAALAARGLEIARIEAPATLDGGDVMVVDRQVFVGLSARTDAAGLDALSKLLEPHGYGCVGVPVGAGLHFKSSVNLIGPGLLVTSPAFAGRPELQAFEQLLTSPEEAYAANVVWINEVLLMASGFPQLEAALGERCRARGVELVTLDMSEVEKMDGGLSCLSLRLPAR